MKKRLLVLAILTVFCNAIPVAGIPISHQKYVIIPEKSHIHCWARYLVMPKLHGEFKKFSGDLVINQEDITQSSVDIKINVGSIQTGRKKIDRILRSKRLLDSEAFPESSFVSTSITRDKGKYIVKGMLTLHGITKEVSGPFQWVQPFKGKDGKQYLKAQARWLVNRKQFGIVWDKVLDHGGLLIGDQITVDWEVLARRE